MEMRAAIAPDLASIAECEARAFGAPARVISGDGTVSHAALLTQIRDGNVCVITKAGRVLGFISFAVNFEHLFVGIIAVLPEHQRQGLGSRLLAAAERRAALSGLDYVSLFSDGSDSPSTAFYRNRGYRETGRSVGPDFLRVYLSKAIAPETDHRDPRAAEAA